MISAGSLVIVRIGGPTFCLQPQYNKVELNRSDRGIPYSLIFSIYDVDKSGLAFHTEVTFSVCIPWVQHPVVAAVEVSLLRGKYVYYLTHLV